VRPGDRWRAATQGSFWLDDPARPEPRTGPLTGRVHDLVVIGGGTTGLWSALRALERSPERSVVLVEAERLAEHASGRNGGFCSASLTHGDANGRQRWPKEMPLLRELGLANLDGLERTLARHQIDCAAERTGQLDLATTEWQVKELREEHDTLRHAGLSPRFLEGAELQSQFGSPVGLAGLLDEDGQLLVNPAQLCWGLASAIESLGGEVLEQTRVTGLRDDGAHLAVITSRGAIRARQVIIATAAAPALVRSARRRVVPVYDYVVVSEPLSTEQLDGLRWSSRRGVADVGNQFHYLRLTADDRILFGGYDALYRFDQRIDAVNDESPATFEVLARHFAEFFPSLDEVAFTHRWGGAIDTSTRFCAAAVKSHDGRVITINGFTGLGLGASRFFADAGLDLLEGISTPATSTSLVQTKPVRFPPEPVRYVGIELTRRAIAKADRDQGRRGPWLRLLDRLGLGFDS
jgi:glycine/D-amino acid oxidase-like deaminating enzyme